MTLIIAWLAQIFLLLALFVGLVVLAVRRHEDAPGRARAVRRVALGFMAVYVAFGSLFIAGETFGDPGGWAALGWVTLWFVPLVGLSLFAWFRPEGARLTLTLLSASVVAVSLWYAFDSQAWRAFENAHGPVRGIAVFALCGALATYGYRRPLLGGVLLVVSSLAPVVLSALASGRLGLTSLGVLAAPATLSGFLYLTSYAFEGAAPTPGSDPPTTSVPVGPSRPR